MRGNGGKGSRMRGTPWGWSLLQPVSYCVGGWKVELSDTTVL